MKKFLLVPFLALCAVSAYGQQVDVLFNRYDSSSTNQNLGETTLTLSNVNSASFGKIYTLSVDGYVYAQPLYKSNLTIPGLGVHNVVFIATEHDSVYAFDADTATPLWQTSFLNPSAGVTSQPSGDTGTTDIIPEVGITSTPVIDPANNSMFVVAKTKENGNAVFRIHVLDITTGAEKVPNVLVQASVPQTGGGTVSVNANWQQQRPGLTLYNGALYIGLGSSGDNNLWQGWLLAYNESTLAQTAVFCVTPSNARGGIWGSGQAPPVDASGNIYVSTGNGNFNGSSDYGDAYIKLSTATNLTVVDYFAPYNQAALDAADLDIASAGPTLLPDSAGTTTHPHLMVAGSKDGTIYVLDRDNMGKYNGSYTNPDKQIVQELQNAIGIIPENNNAIPMAYVENNYSTPAFWSNNLYFCGINDTCKQFTLSNGLVSGPASQSPTSYAFGGAQPVISAASPTATSAILWAVERDTTNNITTLHAMNATNLATELYNGNQAAGNRDKGAPPVKFVVPTVTNGHVFVGAQYEVDVFGLLASNPARLASPTFNPPAGTYTTAQAVVISDASSSAKIYYTLDGSMPTPASTLYTGPVIVSNTATLNAIALQSGMLTSPVGSGTYTIGTLANTGGFIQGNFGTPQGLNASVTVPFNKSQAAGDLNVVAVGWNDTTSSVASISDAAGNTYIAAVGPTILSGFGGQTIYYAKNIVASASNSVTVKFNSTGGAGANSPDIRIAEYGGLDPNNPLDAFAAATGTSANTSSGTAATTSPTELIVGANLVSTVTSGPGTNFNNRMITSPDGDILEDMVVTTTGSYAATAPINPSGQWIMQMATFRGAATTPTPSAPTNLTPTVVSSTQINLSWTASTEAGGTISQYLIQRCAGSGCTNFTQVGTSTTTTFNDTSLVASTTYSYRVAAQDTSNNIGPFSNTATATTLAGVAPAAPTNLAATANGNTQINLTWTASTETGGTISQYLIERCAGSSCTSFAQVGTSTTTSFGDTGLLGSTSYSYRVRAQDSSGNKGPYSNTASATTAAPTITAPTNLAATTVSSTQINLTWTAATETGGTISNYLVERCTGSGCTNFLQVGTPTTTSYSDASLAPSTTYTYRVRATDVPGDLGPYSNTASATTNAGTPPPPTITFIQANSADPQATQATVTVNYTAAQLVGDLNVVVVGWNDGTATVKSVTDTLGNVYNLAGTPTVQSGTATQAIYYAKNILAAAAGANTVTVTFNSAAAFPDIRILEYSGLDQNNPLDVFVGASGSSTSSSSGAATTTNANDLIIGANVVQTATTGPGSGFTKRILTNPDLDIVEDKIVSVAGSNTAIAPVNPSGKWVMQMVAFKQAAAVVPTAPTGLTATANGPTQINLSWTASTETGGTIGQYLVERCAGSGCTNFVQVGTSTTTTYGDTGLTGSTSYTYRVRAQDNSNNTGPYSNTASATTATPTFIAPSALAATASGPTQVGLSWTAATETGGTITQYLVERCTGASCTTFGQIGTTTATTLTYTDTGLLGSTVYNYRVRATDGTNDSGYSNTATATTAAPTFTAPSNLTATAASSTQINLSWTAATETGGTITQYLIQRCSGASCTSFTQVGTSTGTTYSDSSLTPSTSYSYRVQATDASSNTSAFSNTASATTLATSPTAPTSLTATASGPVQINLSWGASTETGGTISLYLVERCSGASCTSFVQIGTTATTSYNDTGLTGSTSYSYRVRAQDSNNNDGPYSNTASATTAAPTFTAPSGLTATASGPTQVGLSWTAATETGGTITKYLVERCTGASCTTFAQIGTSTTLTYTDTGLLGSTVYNYRVRATDGTNNSAYSNTASATTAAPTFTAPSNLTATVAGNTQINLSWTAAAETGGTITQYLIQSCTGASCTNFTQIGTSTTTTFNNTGLVAGTTYSYRVEATDASGNTSPFSNTATATTSTAPPPPIAFVQSNSSDPQTPQTTITVKYNATQGAGDLNVIAIGWNDSNVSVSAVTDTSGNAYTPALATTVQSGVGSQIIYYAPNIAGATAGTNTVSVTFTGPAVFPDIRILEYSGIAVTSPVDVTTASSGNSTSSSSGAVTTTNANDLIIGANLVQTATTGAGSGYTSRMITSPDADIVEDRVVTATGSYTATAPVAPSGQWIMQLVAFKRHP
jgi:hypothetical protein